MTAGIYLLKVNNRNKGVVLMSFLLTLNLFHTCSSVFIVIFEQENTGRLTHYGQGCMIEITSTIKNLVS